MPATFPQSSCSTRYAPSCHALIDRTKCCWFSAVETWSWRSEGHGAVYDHIPFNARPLNRDCLSSTSGDVRRAARAHFSRWRAEAQPSLPHERCGREQPRPSGFTKTMGQWGNHLSWFNVPLLCVDWGLALRRRLRRHNSGSEDWKTAGKSATHEPTVRENQTSDKNIIRQRKAQQKDLKRLMFQKYPH